MGHGDAVQAGEHEGKGTLKGLQGVGEGNGGVGEHVGEGGAGGVGVGDWARNLSARMPKAIAKENAAVVTSAAIMSFAFRRADVSEVCWRGVLPRGSISG